MSRYFNGVLTGAICLVLLYATVFPESKAQASVVQTPECLTPPPPSYDENCTATPPKGFNQMIENAAMEFDVDPRVLATTVYRESGCNHKATGSSGDTGLGQIVPKSWLTKLRNKGIATKSADLYDPRTNLRATAYILHQLRKEAHGDARKMFERYNGRGPLARKYASEQVALYRRLWGMDPVI